MKIVIIGGSGRIGSRVTARLRELGHDALPASPQSGVNAVTGEGLGEALEGAEVVVDVANSPTFETEAAMAFFQSAGRNLREAEAAAGVRHHVALSVVGTERLQEMGYFRAKLAQERLIEASGIPFTILRATQFFEFIGAIAEDAGVGQEVHPSTAMMQPMASDDVARALADVALAEPAGAMIEVAGPEPLRISELVRRFLAAQSDRRVVVPDEAGTYFGLTLDDHSLMPGPNARLGTMRFADWLRRSTLRPHAIVR